MSAKPGGKSGTRAPEHTLEEVKYLKRLIEQQIPVRVRLSNNEEVDGDRRVLRCIVHSHHAQGRAESFHFQARHQVPDRGGRLSRRMPSYLETAVEIAREAGALLADFFERHIPFELKGEFDLVTEADRASERLIVERLRTHFPSHAHRGRGGRRATRARPAYRWYVDPLDGTTNFAHGFPCFNVTLALETAGRTDRRRDLRSDHATNCSPRSAARARI